MKKTLLIFLISLSTHLVFGQNINLGPQGAALYDCSTNGKLYDFGGSTSGYTAGQSFTLVVCPNPPIPAGTPVAFEFVSANFGHPNDFLAFFDGAGTVAPADFIYSFSQTSSQTVGTTYRTTISNITGCITLQFVSDPTSPGGNFEFNILCLPACQSVVANQPLSSIAVQPLEPKYIHSCLKDPITFTGSGTYDTNQSAYAQSDATSKFYWDFGSAGYDTGMVVSPSFNPGIYPIKLIVEDVAGCQSVNEVNLSVRQTLIPNVKFLPSDTTVCLDDIVDVSAYLITTSNEILHVGDTAVYDTLKVQTSVTIKDTTYLPDDADGIPGNGITTPAVYEFPIFGYQPGATLQDVNDLFFVCLDIEHSYIGDLDIILQCPNGQTLALIDYTPLSGGFNGSWDFGEPITGTTPGAMGVPYTYCWSPAANPGDSIAAGNAGLVSIGPNSAVDTSIHYFPTEGSWNSLIGCPLNGNWTIQVFDDWGGDDGYVFGAAIEFDGSFALNPDTFIVAYENPIWNANSQISSPLNNDSIVVNLINSPFETLTFSFEDNLGCSWTKDYDGITVSTVDINNVFKDTVICSSDTLSITANEGNSAATCNYAIKMYDTWGDGWNGNVVKLYADGVLIKTFTLSNGSLGLEDFELTNGLVLEFEFNTTNGNWSYENSFDILDAEGNLIFNSGYDPASGILFTTTSDCLGGNVFVWGPASDILSSDANTAQVYPTANTNYWVEVTNKFGCIGTDTSTVIFDITNTPIIDFSNLPVEFCCTGTELEVKVNDFVSGPPIGQILINGVTKADNSFRVTSEDFYSDSTPIIYTIQVFAQNGCSASKTIELKKHCIEPSISVVDTIYVGDSQLFTASVTTTYDSMTYAWSTTDISQGAITDPLASNAVYNGIYENSYLASLAVTAYFNQKDNTILECTENVNAQNYEVVDVLDLKYPDAFTPNNDDINNLFRPIMSTYGEIVDFRVYNRWGVMVYDYATSDNKDGWDGKYKGKDQPNGVYVYYMKIKSFDKVITKEATVTLLR